MSFLDPNDGDSPNTAELRELLAALGPLIAADLYKEYQAACKAEHSKFKFWGQVQRTDKCKRAKQVLVDHLDQFNLAGSEYDPR